MARSLKSIACCAFIALTASPLTAQHSGASCSIVDRGDPLDGTTTVTVLQAEKACAEGPVWSGWNCMTLRSDANSNGANYRMEVRWNRIDESVRGSFIWIKGNFSTDFHRGALPFATQVQDVLSDLDKVRTIEVRFLGNGTGAYPKNGFANISAVFADLTEFLVAEKVATGVTGFFGSSAGATLGANALAFHDLDQLIDGFVAGGGPYGGDLLSECTDPTSPVFMDADQRAIMDNWNWKDTSGQNYCQDMLLLPDPSYECLSALGPEADTDFGDMLVAVVIGENDGKKPWIKNSAWGWLTSIEAQGKSFDEPLAYHQVLKEAEGALVIYERISQIVNTMLRR